MHGIGDSGTFSIVASDVARGYWGVAVSTHPISVGAVVPWAEFRVGAIATQANSNYHYGPQGLALLRKGFSSQEVVAKLVRADSRREHRQLAIVDRRGRTAAWTGNKCVASALHVTGEGFACQGNMLANDDVVQAMATTFDRCRGTLGTRMLQALKAGDRSGGDRRGIQSAALLVVHRERWFAPEWGDRVVDLRVDQHATPLRELERLVKLDEAETLKFLRARAARLRRRRQRAS